MPSRPALRFLDFMMDKDGVIMTWNPGAERLQGYTRDEIVGTHFGIFYTEADRARSHPAEELRIAARVGRYEEEGWRVRKDGSRFWAAVVITANVFALVFLAADKNEPIAVAAKERTGLNYLKPVREIRSLVSDTRRLRAGGAAPDALHKNGYSFPSSAMTRRASCVLSIIPAIRPAPVP